MRASRRCMATKAVRVRGSGRGRARRRGPRLPGHQVLQPGWPAGLPRREEQDQRHDAGSPGPSAAGPRAQRGRLSSQPSGADRGRRAERAEQRAGEDVAVGRRGRARAPTIDSISRRAGRPGAGCRRRRSAGSRRARRRRRSARWSAGRRRRPARPGPGAALLGECQQVVAQLAGGHRVEPVERRLDHHRLEERHRSHEAGRAAGDQAHQVRGARRTSQRTPSRARRPSRGADRGRDGDVTQPQPPSAGGEPVAVADHLGVGRQRQGDQPAEHAERDAEQTGRPTRRRTGSDARTIRAPTGVSPSMPRRRRPRRTRPATRAGAARRTPRPGDLGGGQVRARVERDGATGRLGQHDHGVRTAMTRTSASAEDDRGDQARRDGRSSPPLSAAGSGRRPPILVDRRGPVTPEGVTGPGRCARGVEDQPAMRRARVAAHRVEAGDLDRLPEVEACTICPLPMYMATWLTGL